MEEITVQELQKKIENGENVFLLDVREHFEKYQSDIAHENTMLIPMRELPHRIDDLEEKQDQPIVCLCRSGSRSADACQMLKNKGFNNVKNLKGGINEWARTIDPRLPVY